MTLQYAVWLCTTLDDSVWSYTTLYCTVWLWLTLLDSIGHCMTVYGPECHWMTLLARAVGVQVGRRSGGWLEWPIFTILFFSPSQPFLIEGVLRLKNIFSESWREHPNTCWPFWGPLVAILDFWGSRRRNDWIKNLFSKSCLGGPIT